MCEDCERYRKTYYENHRQQEIDRAKRSQNKDRVKTNKYKRELKRRNPVGYMVWHLRAQAKRNGIPFNLTKEDIVIPEFCPVLNIPLQMNDGYSQSNSLSVDRLIPELGYVKGNISIISHKANTMKNTATLQELKNLVQWLEKRLTHES